jgi:type I restriction enzyme, S subunit
MEKELPVGWEWRKVGDVIENIPLTGKKLPNSEYDEEGIIPVIDQGQNLIGGYTNRENLKITTDFPLIGFGDHTRILKFIDFEFVPGADGIKILKPSKEFDPKFFYYAVKSSNILDLGYSRHFKILKEVIIPLPPLPVQRQIVAVLEQAEAVMLHRLEADHLTGVLLQSVFQEMFGDPVRNKRGWDIVKFDEICDEITVGIVVRPASYYVENGVPTFRSLNIRPDKLNLDNLVYIRSSENDTILSKSKIRSGDVLVVRTGYPGTACVVPPKFDGANCIDLIILRPKKQIINSEYLSRFLNSDYGKAQALAGNTGLAQQHLNVGAIRQVKIPLPPLALQQQFSLIVQDVERIRERQADSKGEIGGLFDGLIARAFEGELVSGNPCNK